MVYKDTLASDFIIVNALGTGKSSRSMHFQVKNGNMSFAKFFFGLASFKSYFEDWEYLSVATDCTLIVRPQRRRYQIFS